MLLASTRSHPGVLKVTLPSLVSGAANGALSMWDLEAATSYCDDGLQEVTMHRPIGAVESYGITGLSFYPFDSLAFLASSYDHTVKVYDSTTLGLSATFGLESVVYAHAISPIATHLLIACATQHPTVRLADLRSGSTAHSLAGHGGAAILSVAWSPKNEHILASGASDGSVHVWDVRRSVGSLGVLNMEDSVGMTGHDQDRHRHDGKAHIGPVNGLTWTGDGGHLVSVGHDERIRVWDMAIGANTLANFGPLVRNTDLANKSLLVAPRELTPSNEDVLFFPNGRETLMFELYEGRLLKRLKAPHPSPSVSQSHMRGQRNVTDKIMHLSWRTHHIEMLSAHADGSLRSWRPRTSVDAALDELEQQEQQRSQLLV
ncbi:MAG: hypothetical protein Q9162_005693 [Coniocarpon cinnabarinum]